MDEEFFRLIEKFPHDFAVTRPPDQEALALAYLHRAYELGKEAGRTGDNHNRREDYPVWQRRMDESGGGESGPDA